MFGIKNPEFVATIESAQNMIKETFDVDVSQVTVQEGGMSNRYLGNYNLKLQLITIDTKSCEALNVDPKLVLLHEYVHYIERLEGPALLTQEDSKVWIDCVLNCSDKIRKDAETMLKSVQAAKTDDKAYDVYCEALERVVDYINNETVDPQDRPLWKFLKQNLDKINDTIDYNDLDGHTDLWMELKEALEEYWNIEIPVALAIDAQSKNIKEKRLYRKHIVESYEDFDAQTISSYIKNYTTHLASKKFDYLLDFLDDLNDYLQPLNVIVQEEMGHSGVNWVTPNIAFASLREDGRITVEIDAQQLFEGLIWDWENDWAVEKDTEFNQFLKELGQVIIHECVHAHQYSKGYPNKPWKDTDPGKVGMYKYLSSKDEIAAHGIAAVQEALDLGYSLDDVLRKISNTESAADLIMELSSTTDYNMFFDSDDPRDIKVAKMLTKTIANEALKRKHLGENKKKNF